MNDVLAPFIGGGDIPRLATGRLASSALQQPLALAVVAPVPVPRPDAPWRRF